ncbi:MAG TPA: hypothetical protein PLQ35_03975 [bacterium]|nr:hypothetical protein [bacterium]
MGKIDEMTETESKRVVIDASIAGAAGGEAATYSTSINCTNFLNVFYLDTDLIMVMTLEIRGEWKEHRSNFAYTFLANMVSDDRICSIQEDDLLEIRKLKSKMDPIPLRKKLREDLEKDFILIEAALATDKTVISLDDKARKGFEQISQELKKLRSIVWVNPDRHIEAVLSWLKDGANPVEEYRLGFRSG